MIVIPIMMKPEKYRKIIRTNVENVNVDFEVDTIVFFKERTVERVQNVSISTPYHSVLEYEPAVGYGFKMVVRLSWREYESNKINLHEYVCNKAKESWEYQKMLQECLSKVSSDREYEVETYLSVDPKSRKVNTIKTDQKEYVPV